LVEDDHDTEAKLQRHSPELGVARNGEADTGELGFLDFVRLERKGVELRLQRHLYGPRRALVVNKAGGDRGRGPPRRDVDLLRVDGAETKTKMLSSILSS
jgi:hypothetical protein